MKLHNVEELQLIDKSIQDNNKDRKPFKGMIGHTPNEYWEIKDEMNQYRYELDKELDLLLGDDAFCDRGICW